MILEQYDARVSKERSVACALLEEFVLFILFLYIRNKRVFIGGKNIWIAPRIEQNSQGLQSPSL